MTEFKSPTTDLFDVTARQLADALPSIVWSCDSELNVAFFNKRWYEQTGQLPNEALDQGWVDVLHPDDLKALLSSWDDIIADRQQSYEFELRYRMADGNYRWHLINAITVFNEAGEIDRFIGISMDINDKRREVSDRQAETKSIVESAVDGIIAINERGIVQSINPAAVAIFGYRTDEVIGENIKMLMPEPYHSQHDGYLSNFHQTGARKIIGSGREVVGRRKDGSTFPMDLAVSEVELADRRFFTGIVRDITQRKRLEKEIRGHTQVLELLAKGGSLTEILTMLIETAEAARPGMLGSVLLLDEETGCLRHGATNRLPEPYCKAIDGVKIGPSAGSCGTAAFIKKRVIVEDIQGHPFWADFRDIAEKSSLRACWSEPILSSDGKALGTFAMYYQEPRQPNEADLEFVSNSANVAALAIERVNADTAIRESQRQLSTMVSNLMGAAYRCRNDKNWTMEFISDGCFELLGYTPDEIVAGNPSFNDLIHPDDRDAVWELVQTRLKNRQSYQLGYRIQHRNGESRWIWAQGQGVFSEDRKLVALEGLISDVTELHNTREQLVQSERLAAIGKLMSAIAHESRNALQRIQAGVDMLKLDIPEDSEAGRDLAQIARASNDLQTLLDELRNYAAPIQLARQRCNLADVWNRAWENLAVVRNHRTAELSASIEGIDLNCSIDSFRIEQVFRNLIENALAAASGPARIRIGATETTMKGVPAVCVSVSDNGPGLSNDQASRIFEAFYTTKQKGTGLGMSIAKRIIEAHHGTLVAGNARNGETGAEFTITLPR